MTAETVMRCVMVTAGEMLLLALGIFLGDFLQCSC